MSTRRQIFKLWKLLSDERLLPRKNLKSRTGPWMRAGTAGPRQPVGAGEGRCTHLVASFREFGRISACLRCHERGGILALAAHSHGQFVLRLRELYPVLGAILSHLRA